MACERTAAEVIADACEFTEARAEVALKALSDAGYLVLSHAEVDEIVVENGGEV